MRIVIGQKSTNPIAQYMEESWRGFCTLFTLKAKIASMDFGSLLKEFLGVLPSRFEGVKKHSKGLRVIFREYSGIIENDILTMQRFLDVSRFLYPGGWQVCYMVIEIVASWETNQE